MSSSEAGRASRRRESHTARGQGGAVPSPRHSFRNDQRKRAGSYRTIAASPVSKSPQLAIPVAQPVNVTRYHGAALLCMCSLLFLCGVVVPFLRVRVREPLSKVVEEHHCTSLVCYPGGKGIFDTLSNSRALPGCIVTGISCLVGAVLALLQVGVQVGKGSMASGVTVPIIFAICSVSSAVSAGVAAAVTADTLSDDTKGGMRVECSAGVFLLCIPAVIMTPLAAMLWLKGGTTQELSLSWRPSQELESNASYKQPTIEDPTLIEDWDGSDDPHHPLPSEPPPVPPLSVEGSPRRIGSPPASESGTIHEMDGRSSSFALTLRTTSFSDKHPPHPGAVRRRSTHASLLGKATIFTEDDDDPVLGDTAASEEDRASHLLFLDMRGGGDATPRNSAAPGSPLKSCSERSAFASPTAQSLKQRGLLHPTEESVAMSHSSIASTCKGDDRSVATEPLSPSQRPSKSPQDAPIPVCSPESAVASSLDLEVWRRGSVPEGVVYGHRQGSVVRMSGREVPREDDEEVGDDDVPEPTTGPNHGYDAPESPRSSLRRTSDMKKVGSVRFEPAEKVTGETGGATPQSENLDRDRSPADGNHFSSQDDILNASPFLVTEGSPCASAASPIPSPRGMRGDERSGACLVPEPSPPHPPPSAAPLTHDMLTRLARVDSRTTVDAMAPRGSLTTEGTDGDDIGHTVPLQSPAIAVEPSTPQALPGAREWRRASSPAILRAARREAPPPSLSALPIRRFSMASHRSLESELPRYASFHTVRSQISHVDSDGSLLSGGLEPMAVKETKGLDKGVSASGNKILNDYEQLREIGRGAFSKVKLCRDRRTCELRALKVIKKSLMRQIGRMGGRGSSVTTALHKVRQEIAILKKIRHRNLITLFEVIDDTDGDKLILVMEYAAQGAVGEVDMLTGELVGSPLSEDRMQHLMTGMVSGLRYLHKCRVLHRDIKPENVLIGHDGQAKLSDFNVSHVWSANTGDVVRKTEGTPAYFPPEALGVGHGMEFRGTSADIWSLGVTIYVLVIGRLPFHSTDRRGLRDAILHSKLHIPKSLSPHLRDLLSRMLRRDSRWRPSMREIYYHPFLRPECTPNQTPTISRVKQTPSQGRGGSQDSATSNRWGSQQDMPACSSQDGLHAEDADEKPGLSPAVPFAVREEIPKENHLSSSDSLPVSKEGSVITPLRTASWSGASAHSIPSLVNVTEEQARQHAELLQSLAAGTPRDPSLQHQQHQQPPQPPSQAYPPPPSRRQSPAPSSRRASDHEQSESTSPPRASRAGSASNLQRGEGSSSTINTILAPTAWSSFSQTSGASPRSRLDDHSPGFESDTDSSDDSPPHIGVNEADVMGAIVLYNSADRTPDVLEGEVVSTPVSDPTHDSPEATYNQ